MQSPDSRAYEFGPFRLEPGSRRLLCGSQVVALAPKTFHTLLVLVEARGRLVEKDELLGRVWPDTVVEESNLTQSVYTLRKLLGDRGGEGRYIQTVPRRGYRFVAPVREVPERSSKRPRAVGPLPVLLGGTAMVALVLLLAHWVRLEPDHPVLPGGKRMIVVLPFEALGGETAGDYLSEGLTEEMITELCRLNPARLGVIARSTALRYRNREKSAREIAAELEVDYILEGSVRREGRRVRITVQLVEARRQTHLWAGQYDREWDQLLALQQEVVRSIAEELRVRLVPARQGADPAAVDPVAYEAYLKGRHFWNRRSLEGRRRAQEYFREAISLAPDFAPAYAALSETYAAQPLARLRGEAETAALRALHLDETLPHARVSWGILLMRKFQWDQAEREFRRALELDPNSAHARIWYSTLLQALGRTEEGVAEARRALRFDPLSPVANQLLGTALYLARRYDEAIERLETTIELDPHFLWAYLRLAQCHTGKGEFERAKAVFAAAPGIDPVVEVRLAHTYAVAGETDRARAILQAKHRSASTMWYDMAAVHAALGEYDQAFALLEVAVAEYDYNVVLLLADPRLDPLRSVPRYGELVRAAGLRP